MNNINNNHKINFKKKNIFKDRNYFVCNFTLYYYYIIIIFIEINNNNKNNNNNNNNNKY